MGDLIHFHFLSRFLWYNKQPHFPFAKWGIRFRLEQRLQIIAATLLGGSA